MIWDGFNAVNDVMKFCILPPGSRTLKSPNPRAHVLVKVYVKSGCVTWVGRR
jgi:hypothetical protein